MEYTNAEILAAVVADWSRPAISQIASSKLGSVSFMQNIQQWLSNNGLVGIDYKISNELLPFCNTAIDSLLEPILIQQFSKIPDETIPTLARGFVTTAMQQPHFSLLNGLVSFDADDLKELLDLLNKNFNPVKEAKKYQVKK